MTNNQQKGQFSKDKARFDLVQQVLSFPRITRILIAAVFAVAVTFAISPIIDEVYLRYFFAEGTAYVPALISAGFGLLMYGIGWFAIVGVVGETLQVRRRFVRYYMGVGIAALLIVAFWVIRLLFLSAGA